jgi:hypothetical protein
MEEATGAPSSFADWHPKRLQASGRDGETVMTKSPSPLTVLLSRHTRRREFIILVAGVLAARSLGANAQPNKTKIGFLHPGPAAAVSSRIEALVSGLHASG